MTFAITVIAAWSARESCPVPLNDLGDRKAVPVAKQVYDRSRARTLAHARLA
jgi:hypothetical protein